MLRTVCTAKIHKATVTKTDLHYSGSIGIDTALLAHTGIKKWEQVQIYNVNNGNRFETYVLEEPHGSGSIVVYGAASRLAHAGDKIIIVTYALMTDDELRTFTPVIALVDDHNRIIAGR